MSCKGRSESKARRFSLGPFSLSLALCFKSSRFFLELPLLLSLSRGSSLSLFFLFVSILKLKISSCTVKLHTV